MAEIRTKSRRRWQPVRSSCRWDSPAVRERWPPSSGDWVAWPCQCFFIDPSSLTPKSLGCPSGLYNRPLLPTPRVCSEWWVTEDLSLISLLLSHDTTFTRSPSRWQVVDAYRARIRARWRRWHTAWLPRVNSEPKRRFRRQGDQGHLKMTASALRILDAGASLVRLVCDGRRKAKIRVSFERSHYP